jgi:hypothetical protein
VNIPVLLRFIDPGYLVVSSTFTIPGGSSSGILLIDPDGDVHLIAASGRSHEVRPGDFRTISQVVRSSQLGANGEVTFELIFTDGSEALILASPSGVVAVDPSEHPLELVVPNVHPNPFRAETVIRAELMRPTDIDLAIYDAIGRRLTTLVTGTQGPGLLRASWDGRDLAGRALPPGVYFVRLRQNGDTPSTEKLVLVR